MKFMKNKDYETINENSIWKAWEVFLWTFFWFLLGILIGVLK